MSELPKLESVPFIKIPKNGSRIALLILVFNVILVFANLYLSNGYVAKMTYENDVRDALLRRDQVNNELRDIALKLQTIKDHMEAYDPRQDEELKRLEARIRDLEMHK